MTFDPETKKKIIDCITNNEGIPAYFKDILFPIQSEPKEIELKYGTKEREVDILSNTFALPFQPIMKFGNVKDNEWHNKLIFGDNLQALSFLKKLQEEGRLEKISLVYLDPPFSTEQELKGQSGEKAYDDKIQGAEFLEFLRKRIIFIKKLLSEEGSFLIHLDYRKLHYLKALLDEIFLEHNFRSEIIWRRTEGGKTTSRKIPFNADYILWYSRSSNYYFNSITREFTEKDKEEYKKDDGDGRGKYSTNPVQKTGGRTVGTTYDYKDNNGKVWPCPLKGFITIESKMKALENDNRLVLTGKTIRQKYYLNERIKIGKQLDNIWTDIGNLNRSKKEIVGYPTQKPERLIERLMVMMSKENDIILDCFAGSGTTSAVAEKMQRRWIGIDSSKFALYTILKRLLSLKKEIGQNGNPLTSKPFVIYNAGLYENHSKLLNMGNDSFKKFALQLFQAESREYDINGLQMDGLLLNSPVKVFSLSGYLTEAYLDDLHKTIGSYLTSKIYIIALAGTVDFIADYIEKDGIRYYILRIPYSIIDEIYKKSFTKISQPTSVDEINDIVEQVGFDFNDPPEIKADYSRVQPKGKLVEELLIEIKEFVAVQITKKPIEFNDQKDAISMILIDQNFNEQFKMTDTIFADEIKENKYTISVPIKKLGKKICVIFIDIFGNERIEIKNQSDFKVKKKAKSKAKPKPKTKSKVKTK